MLLFFLRVYFLFFEKFERVYFTNSFMGYFHYFVDVIWHKIKYMCGFLVA